MPLMHLDLWNNAVHPPKSKKGLVTRKKEQAFFFRPGPKFWGHSRVKVYISTINHRIQSLFEGNWTLSTGGSILWVLVCYATSG